MKRIKFKDLWYFIPQNTYELYLSNILDFFILFYELILLIISICLFFEALSLSTDVKPVLIFCIFAFLQLCVLIVYTVGLYCVVKKCYKKREELGNVEEDK